jgi:hypothetical protein
MTTAQELYLRRLFEQCFAKRISVGYDTREALRHPWSMTLASEEITRLKGLLGAAK